MTDARHFVAVARAVTAATVAAIEAGQPVHEAVTAAVLAALGGGKVDNLSSFASDRPAARIARENEKAMEIMADMEAQGHGRNAAATAARRLAIDPHDPAECEILAQRFRRIRLRAKKSAHCSVADEPTC